MRAVLAGSRFPPSRMYKSALLKVHVKHIYEKLGVRSRMEAARALREGV